MRRTHYNPLLGCYRAGDGRWFWLLGLQATRHWPGVDPASAGRVVRGRAVRRLPASSTNRDAVLAILDEDSRRTR